MVGGAAKSFEVVRPCFDLMGTTVERQGESGAGQHTKMVNQILIASGMVGVCEAFLYAHRAGLDAERVLASVGLGAAGSWSLANRAPRILEGDFEPGFYVEHFVKDRGIALEEASDSSWSFPGSRSRDLSTRNSWRREVRAKGPRPWRERSHHARV